MPKNSKTIWVNLGFLPAQVGYVPNARAWRKTLKKLKLDAEPFPSRAGHCMHWTDQPGGEVILVTLRNFRSHTLSQTVGLLAHECQHAWRHIREALGEKEPSAEFEAYVLQAMVQCVVKAHQDSHKIPWTDDA